VKVTTLHIPGLLLLEPPVFADERGAFLESWSRERYARAGVQGEFVQDNVSHSVRGVLRGLHYQQPRAQGKLMSVVHGEVFDVAVDIRTGSPTRRQWTGIALSSENRRQLYIPPGFAHGFQVVSEDAIVLYKCTDYYDHASEHSILWSDEDLAIDWPLEPILSPKDRAAPRLRELPAHALPAYSAE
jgi:dTDP-4-dehydrorhamnose 3,5-epimerase